MKTLAAQFAKLQLHRRYHLNYGGCGFFALTTYKLFKPIMPKLRLVNVRKFDMDYFHVVLEHGILFDSEGLWTPKKFHDLQHISYARLLFDINARDTWNDKFDRKYAPEIEEQIQDLFHRYKHQIVHELSQHKKLMLPSGRPFYARNI